MPWRWFVLLSFAALVTACSGGGVAHDRSYRYGIQIMDRVVESSTTSTNNAHTDCERALRRAPGRFRGYDASRAQAGCVDEWNRVNL
jgi:hypothetical protein